MTRDGRPLVPVQTAFVDCRAAAQDESASGVARVRGRARALFAGRPCTCMCVCPAYTQGFVVDRTTAAAVAMADGTHYNTMMLIPAVYYIMRTSEHLFIFPHNRDSGVWE